MKNFANGAAISGKDPVKIIVALLKELSVPVTDSTVRDVVLSHPYYPSLLCLSESLERWGLDTLALDIPPSGLSQLPCPFLAHCPTAIDEPYWIVKEAGNDRLICMDGRRRTRLVPFQEFCGIWDGKVLVMEKKEVNGEADYSERRRIERRSRMRMALAAIALLLPMAAGLVRLGAGSDRWYLLALFAGNVAAMLVTMLLVAVEHGLGGAGLQRLCSLNDKMSCMAVLNSPGARLFGNISWSETGLVYFAGSLVYGWLAAYRGLPLWPLVLCNYLSFGYVVFSLLYQGLVVRKWCFFCLVIQGILFGEGLLAVIMRQPAGGTAGFATELMGWVSLLAAYGMAAACWTLVKPYWLKAVQAEKLRQELSRLKRNEFVFEALLGQADALRNDPQAVGLVIGDEAAERSIVLISNPYCGPCGEVHEKLERLLESDRRWKLRIIFSIAGQDERAAAVVGSFFHAAAAEGEAGLRRTLRDWYGSGEKERVEWVGKMSREIGDKIASMTEWCGRENIRYTPAVYVDGRRLPEHYDIEDLQFL